jgi:dihydropyrimidine dehydrogenase (NAD+) subunit PreA
MAVDLSVDKAATAGWAGAVTWTAEVTRPMHMVGTGVSGMWFTPTSRDKFIDSPPVVWSYQGSSSKPGLTADASAAPETVQLLVRKAKESGLPIIINLLANPNPDTWVAGCMAAEEAGADMLELNFSYAIQPGVGMHAGWHRNLDKTQSVIKAVKARTSIPVMVKLNAFLIPQEIREWAKACVEAGADAISITNSMPGFAGVDIETGLPLSLSLEMDGGVRGQVEIITGPATKAVALAGVAIVASAVNVPVAAIGGVQDWQDAVEHMMLGASLVQVASAVCTYGHRLVRDLTKGLEAFMERKGYHTTKDFVGLTNNRYRVGQVATILAPGNAQPRKLIVDEPKCTGCGRCLPPCETAGGEAIKMENGVAVIDQEACQKCNLCMLVCPEGAVRVEWDPAYLQR